MKKKTFSLLQNPEAQKTDLFRELLYCTQLSKQGISSKARFFHQLLNAKIVRYVTSPGATNLKLKKSEGTPKRKNFVKILTVPKNQNEHLSLKWLFFLNRNFED